MAHLRWAPLAVDDLESICVEISHDSQAYANLFAQKIISIVETLLRFPRSGRIAPEFSRPDIRERIFQNYRIVYRLNPTSIEVVAIVHGARNLKSALHGRLA